MTCKQFFKSNVFRCLVTLLCILLVCGIFLTIAYAFLRVTDEEKFQRVLSSIYGKTVTTEEQDISSKNTDLSLAKINNVYLVKDDGNYLVNVTGKNAYQGSVICWVVVIPSADKKSVGGIGKVVVRASGNESQSFLNKIGSSVYDNFAKDYSDDVYYSYGFDDNGNKGEMYVDTGASFTMRGVCNAVNATIQFMNAFLSGTDIAEEDPYEDFAFHDYINMESTSWVRSGDTVTYSIVTKPNGPANSFKMTVVVTDGKIDSYEITEYGSTNNDYEAGHDKDYYNDKIDVTDFTGKDADYFINIIGENGEDYQVVTGATYSNYLCLAAGAFATANYEYILNLKYFTDFIDDSTTCEVDGDTVTYYIVTKSNSPADPFKMTVVVTDGKIDSYNITEYGSTDNSYEGHDKDYYNDKISVSDFTGKGVDYFKAIIGNDVDDYQVKTGATRSNYLCLAAGAFATANYEYYKANGGENNE